MGWGDALGKAFANEEMPEKKNPGLKNEAKTCMVRNSAYAQAHLFWFVRYGLFNLANLTDELLYSQQPGPGALLLLLGQA